VGAAFSRELKRSRLKAAPTKSIAACSFQITGLPNPPKVAADKSAYNYGSPAVDRFCYHASILLQAPLIAIQRSVKKGE